MLVIQKKIKIDCFLFFVRNEKIKLQLNTFLRYQVRKVSKLSLLVKKNDAVTKVFNIGTRPVKSLLDVFH